jgi:ribosome biogenesis protein UTP30
MEPEQVVDNVMACTPALNEYIPRGWDNVKSVHIKTTRSLALPVYNCLPDEEKEAKRAHEEAIALSKKQEKSETEEKEEEEEDEVSRKRRKDEKFMQFILKKIKLTV